MYAIPGQAGRRVIVTGVNSGTGREAARRLAGAGARVVLAVRTQDKGEEARDAILAEFPTAQPLRADPPAAAGAARGCRAASRHDELLGGVRRPDPVR